MLEEPVTGYLRVRYPVGSDGKRPPLVNGRDAATVFLQPGKIKISSVDSFSNMQVKGSAAHLEYKKLILAGKPYDEQMKPLNARYSEQRVANDNQGMERTEKEMEAVAKEKKEKVFAGYLKNNPASPVALYALQQYMGWEINPDTAEPLFNSLSESNKNLPSARLIWEEIEIAKRTGIGRMAMDFTQNDTLGHPVSLSSLRGKYLLVDFWASWCGPCRAENPNVVKVFQKYKDRNFHIIGVSLDRPGQQEKWMKAIHDDKLEWTHVSDLQFWNNEVAKQYGIKAIPQNLLLDPDGKIIAKNLRGEELEAKLGEAIEGKKGF
ncbi:MAG: TlpA family protein disulfide reductase [Chitinophagaceae bacterium]|nr:TlpA family protein disulfide reductase [Chitinophagaceae bacterium]